MSARFRYYPDEFKDTSIVVPFVHDMYRRLMRSTLDELSAVYGLLELGHKDVLQKQKQTHKNLKEVEFVSHIIDSNICAMHAV